MIEQKQMEIIRKFHSFLLGHVLLSMVLKIYNSVS